MYAQFWFLASHLSENMNIGSIHVVAISNPHLHSPGQFTDSESTDLIQNVTSLIPRELNSSQAVFETHF